MASLSVPGTEIDSTWGARGAPAQCTTTSVTAAHRRAAS
jgi:hypothetical protein